VDHELAASNDLDRETVAFLYREAELLDNQQLHEWLDLLTPDVDYRVPVRVTRERGATVSPFSETTYHLIEDWGSLKARVDRFDSESAWSEDPPSRTRRIVGNVRVAPAEEPDTVVAKSNLLVYRARGDNPADLLAAERHDVLKRVDGRLNLARRLVLLDHTFLPTHNLAIFL
jgi:3-phenylpropionate/cinnamic acid dioxygenase small subunit